MLWTITFHSGELQRMNRPINTIVPKMLMPDVRHLRVCCLLAPLVLRLTSLIYPPPTLSVLLHKVHTVSTLTAVKTFRACSMPSSYTKQRVAGFWRCIADCSNKRGLSRCDFFRLTVTLERAILRHISYCCHKYFCKWQPPKVLEVRRRYVTTERLGTAIIGL